MASHNVPRAATTEPKTQEQRRQELDAIKEYEHLVDQVTTKASDKIYDRNLFDLTSKLLIKNPEYYTIWNVRRRCLIYGLFSKLSDSLSPSNLLHNTSQSDTPITSSENSLFSTSNLPEASKATPQPRSHRIVGNGSTLELISSELQFLIPLLKKWPKCYWIWNYRMWILEEATKRLDVEIATRLWQEELALDGMMLVKDSRNFHAWGYRRLVVTSLESPKLAGKSLVEEEFAYTTKMVHAHLSNFSAWHYRSKLIPRLLEERGADDVARRSFLNNEFDMMRNALWTDCNDQSLWFYYQYLMTTLTDHVGHASIVPNFSENDRVEYISRQLVDLKDMLEGAEDCKWIYNALLEYTLAVSEMEERQPSDDEKFDLISWLAQLRILDPMRGGRWDDTENKLQNPLRTE